MAWIYLAESEDSVRHWNLGSNQWRTVKSTDTAKLSSLAVKHQVICMLHPSGTTFSLSYEKAMAAGQLLTLSMEASRARTSAVQELEKAWMESEVGFSGNLSDSSKKQTRLGCFSKTSQPLELADLRQSSKRLPIWGMTVGGLAYLPLRLEPAILEKGGSCLPTPTAQTYGSNQGGAMGRHGQKKRESLAAKARKGLLPTPMARDWKGTSGKNRDSPSLADTVNNYLNPAYVEELMGYEIGWTELKDWAMQWYQSKPKRRSKG